MVPFVKSYTRNAEPMEHSDGGMCEHGAVLTHSITQPWHHGVLNQETALIIGEEGLRLARWTLVIGPEVRTSGASLRMRDRNRKRRRRHGRSMCTIGMHGRRYWRHDQSRATGGQCMVTSGGGDAAGGGGRGGVVGSAGRPVAAGQQPIHGRSQHRWHAATVAPPECQTHRRNQGRQESSRPSCTLALVNA